jgi:hypothetical protein
MVEVSRELDGDSGHLVIDNETDEVLLPHITHRYRQHNTIGFRTRGNDAPEIATAFRLYGKHVGRSTRRQVLQTYHSGVESMRCTQRILATSHCVFFRIPMDESRLPAHDVDKDNRLLLYTYVEENEGDECISLAEHIAKRAIRFPSWTDDSTGMCSRQWFGQNRHIRVLSRLQMKPDSSHTSLPIPRQVNIEIINIRDYRPLLIWQITWVLCCVLSYLLYCVALYLKNHTFFL